MEYYRKEDVINALTNLEINLRLIFGEENAYVFMAQNIREMIS